MLCRDGKEGEDGEVTLDYDEPRWKRMPSLDEVVMSLADRAMLPAIYFIFSRAACDNAALLLDKQGVSLTTPDEQIQILYELESLRSAFAVIVLASHRASFSLCLFVWMKTLSNLQLTKYIR